jgi:hypothetical protein
MRPETGGLRYPEQSISFRLYPEGWWVRAGSKIGFVLAVLTDCHGSCYGYHVQFGLSGEAARFCKRSPKLLSATRKEVEIITGRRFPNGKSTTTREELHQHV